MKHINTKPTNPRSLRRLCFSITNLRASSRRLCFSITNVRQRLFFRGTVTAAGRGLLRRGGNPSGVMLKHNLRRLHRRRGRRPTCLRAGVSMVELMVSCLLIGCVAGMVVPTVSWTAVERRAAHKRQAACEEVANLMDRLTRHEWDDVTEQRAQELGLAEEIERQLPDAQLSATVDTDQDAKRVQLSLSWVNRGGRTVAPVRLTTWIYREPTADQASVQEGES